VRGFIPLSIWRSRAIHAAVKKAMSAFEEKAKRTSPDQMNATVERVFSN